MSKSLFFATSNDLREISLEEYRELTKTIDRNNQAILYCEESEVYLLWDEYVEGTKDYDNVAYNCETISALSY